jgi:maltose-binding protein MalE
MIANCCRGSRWLPDGRRLGRWQRPLQIARIVALDSILLSARAGCDHAKDARTDVLIWHQKIGGERDLFNQHIARFNAAYSDCVAETLYNENEELRNLFVIAAVAGQGPDIIYGPADNFGIFVTE